MSHTQKSGHSTRSPASVEGLPALDTTRTVQRQDLVVGAHIPHLEKLRAARAVDLRDNVKIEHLPGGYLRIVPRDPTRRF